MEDAEIEYIDFSENTMQTIIQLTGIKDPEAAARHFLNTLFDNEIDVKALIDVMEGAFTYEDTYLN